MTDYKNLKLIATSNPHIRSNETTSTIMRDVIIALLPALVFACVRFGARAIALTAVSVVGCVFWEWLYRKLMKKPQSVGDLSAALTGVLLAFVSPVTTPYWMIVIGGFFAIVVVKQLFGGGLFLGAFFMATDYVTSPVTKKGQLIFGIGCGLFTVLIRYFGSYNEGVCYSIMVMNLLVPLIDKWTKPARFGVVKSDKKEAAAK